MPRVLYFLAYRLFVLTCWRDWQSPNRLLGTFGLLLVMYGLPRLTSLKIMNIVEAKGGDSTIKEALTLFSALLKENPKNGVASFIYDRPWDENSNRVGSKSIGIP